MPSIENAKEKMEAALTALSREFTTVRTGKATPALLDTVRVDAYGSKMPIDQLAEKSHYLEVCYLLLSGELPTKDQKEKLLLEKDCERSQRRTG